uniref:ATP synthase complex subunit 8 n=1 Tax=Caecilia tentaculata TaxID=356198 RepID=W5RH79_CAETE|nr:ATP synthase F0 subunit 8 [Caecilia tentaculata]AGZ18890.1 ATP synthase F0 subunit 8 [Caecilia tentaculata]
MPQVNPAPWFMILFATWMLLLMILTKTIKHEPTNSTCLTKKHTHYPSPWAWPW